MTIDNSSDSIKKHPFAQFVIALAFGIALFIIASVSDMLPCALQVAITFVMLNILL